MFQHFSLAKNVFFSGQVWCASCTMAAADLYGIAQIYYICIHYNLQKQQNGKILKIRTRKKSFKMTLKI